jgi:hypothetical protein
MDLSIMHLRRTNGCLIKGSNAKVHMQSINDGRKMHEWKNKVPSSSNLCRRCSQTVSTKSQVQLAIRGSLLFVSMCCLCCSTKASIPCILATCELAQLQLQNLYYQLSKNLRSTTVSFHNLGTTLKQNAG